MFAINLITESVMSLACHLLTKEESPSEFVSSELTSPLIDG